MIDNQDKQTQPLDLGPAPKRRGRPAKQNALSNAERQRRYREAQKAQKAAGRTVSEGEMAVGLTNQEATVIISLLQDWARDVATKSLCGEKVSDSQKKSAEFMSNLARKVARARFPLPLEIKN